MSVSKVDSPLLFRVSVDHCDILGNSNDLFFSLPVPTSSPTATVSNAEWNWDTKFWALAHYWISGGWITVDDSASRTSCQWLVEARGSLQAWSYTFFKTNHATVAEYLNVPTKHANQERRAHNPSSSQLAITPPPWWETEIVHGSEKWQEGQRYYDGVYS